MVAISTLIELIKQFKCHYILYIEKNGDVIIMAESMEHDDAQIQEEDVWSSISSNEEVLERVPNDHKALHSLSVAYGQIGDHTKAKEYIVRLADVALLEKNGVVAIDVLNNLRLYAEDDPSLNEILLQIDLLSQTAVDKGAASLSSGKKKTSLELKAESATFSLAREMTFAWKLVESGDLSQAEYAGVINDLTEMSGQADDLTISLLHVLESRNIGDVDKYMGSFAEKCGTPIISLDNFEITLETVFSLPINFVVARGAMVFDFVGAEALVAILNPYDLDVRSEVKELLNGKICHFFVTQSSQFDRRVERAREIIKDRENAQS